MGILANLLGRKEGGAALVLDVGSASVGAAVLYLDSNKPQIYAFERVHTGVLREYSKSETLAGLRISAANAVDRAMKHGFKRLKQDHGECRSINFIYCYFSSPWSITRTREVRFENNQAVSYTEKFIDSKLREEEERIRKELMKEAGRSVKGEAASSSGSSKGSGKPGGFYLVDRNIIKTRLNGYETKDPFMKKASSVSISLFMSVVSSAAYDIVEKKGLETSPDANVRPHAFALAAVDTINELKENLADYTLMSITGECTDISAIKDGMLVETLAVGIGANAMVRRVAKEFDAPKEIAASLIKLHNDNLLEPEVSQRVGTALSAGLKEWREGVWKAASELASRHGETHTITLVAANDILAAFEAELSNESGGDIIAVKPELFGETSELHTDKEPDAFLMLGCVFAHKLNKRESGPADQ